MLRDQEAHRLPWLLPIRHGRMAHMVINLAWRPIRGVMVQRCGDVHLMNVGI